MKHYINKDDVLKILLDSPIENLTKSEFIDAIICEIDKLTVWKRCLSIVDKYTKGEWDVL